MGKNKIDKNKDWVYKLLDIDIRESLEIVFF